MVVPRVDVKDMDLELRSVLLKVECLAETKVAWRAVPLGASLVAKMAEMLELARAVTKGECSAE